MPENNVDVAINPEWQLAAVGDAVVILDLGRNEYFTATGDLASQLKHQSPSPLPEPTEPGGVVTATWTGSPHIERRARTRLRDTATAVGHLHRAHRLMARGGIAAVAAALRSAHAAMSAVPPSPNRGVTTDSLVEAHVRARMAYPRATYCLAGSVALAFHAWSVGLGARFVIGVHTPPFFAHAWVEHDGDVINDTGEVARRLAPILRIG